MTTRTATALLVLALTSAGATGCSSGSTEPERSATCGALQAAVDDAQRQVEVAIAEITSDPGAARDTATAVRKSLASASSGVAADERDYVTRADKTLARLVRQARKSAAGEEVDGEVVGSVRTELLAVVQDVRAVC